MNEISNLLQEKISLCEKVIFQDLKKLVSRYLSTYLNNKTDNCINLK